MRINERQLDRIIHNAILNEGIDELGIGNVSPGAISQGIKNVGQKIRNWTNNGFQGYGNDERGEGRFQNGVNGNDYIGQLYNNGNELITQDTNNQDDKVWGAYDNRMNGKQNPNLAKVPQTFMPNEWERLRLYQDIYGKVEGYKAGGYFGNNPNVMEIVDGMIGACAVGKGNTGSMLVRAWEEQQGDWEEQQGSMVSESLGDYFRNRTNSYGVQTGVRDRKQNFLGRLFFPRTKQAQWAVQLKNEIEYAISKGCWAKDRQTDQQVGSFLKILSDSYGLPVSGGIFGLLGLAGTCTNTGGGGNINNTMDYTPQQEYNINYGIGQSNINDEAQQIQNAIQAFKNDPNCIITIQSNASAIKKNPNFDQQGLMNDRNQNTAQELINGGVNPENIRFAQGNEFGGQENQRTKITVTPGNNVQNQNYFQNTGSQQGGTTYGSGWQYSPDAINLNEAKLNRIIKESIRQELRKQMNEWTLGGFGKACKHGMPFDYMKNWDFRHKLDNEYKRKKEYEKFQKAQDKQGKRDAVLRNDL